MKKLIVIIAALLFLAVLAEAAPSQERFLNKMENAIYKGSRSGKLSKREVRKLKADLNNFEKLLWKYESNGKISRRENRKLNAEKLVIEDKLYEALYNAERRNRGKAFHKKKKKGKNAKAQATRQNRYGPICRLPSQPTRDERY